jgi:hypothetical protein
MPVRMGLKKKIESQGNCTRKTMFLDIILYITVLNAADFEGENRRLEGPTYAANFEGENGRLDYYIYLILHHQHETLKYTLNVRKHSNCIYRSNR